MEEQLSALRDVLDDVREREGRVHTDPPRVRTTSRFSRHCGRGLQDGGIRVESYTSVLDRVGRNERRFGHRTFQDPVLPGREIFARILALVDRESADGRVDEEVLIAKPGELATTG